MSEKRKVDELFDLTGHVAVITGAGRGIGEGIAVAMSEAGASVVVAARRTEEIERVANEIFDAFNNKGNSVKKREETHKMAEANRAFSLFRW